MMNEFLPASTLEGETGIGSSTSTTKSDSFRLSESTLASTLKNTPSFSLTASINTVTAVTAAAAYFANLPRPSIAPKISIDLLTCDESRPYAKYSMADLMTATVGRQKKIKIFVIDLLGKLQFLSLSLRARGLLVEYSSVASEANLILNSVKESYFNVIILQTGSECAWSILKKMRSIRSMSYPVIALTCNHSQRQRAIDGNVSVCMPLTTPASQISDTILRLINRPPPSRHCFLDVDVSIYPGAVPAAIKLYHILVVDDSIVCLKIFKTFLVDSNFRVSLCDNASSALSMLYINQSAFDLIIMDVYMPDMCGISALKKCKELGYKVPIISTSSDFVNVAELFQEGAAAFVEVLNMCTIKIAFR